MDEKDKKVGSVTSSGKQLARKISSRAGGQATAKASPRTLLRKDTTTLGELVSRLWIGNELLWRPARLVQFEHWAGHIPFAFWIIKCLRPRLLVELGTHRGNSYCAFCQAIASLQLDTKAFAIDTWEGDLHMRAEQGALEDLKEYHDRLYGSFSSLMQMQFD